MAKKKDRTYDSLQNPFDGFDCFPKGEVENVKLMLMTMASHTGITPEEYAAFIAQGGMSAFQERRVNAYVDEYLNNSCSNPEEKALPDADQKSLRLKIQMKGVSKPPMWREIVIPADFNFFQLHLAIQAVIGLYDAHLWQFQHKAYDSGLQIGIPADDNDGFGLYEYTNDANSTPVTSYLSEKGDKLEYVYDFGDDWIFKVSVEEVMDHPVDGAHCTRWKGDLQPLEDTGGIWAYTTIRDAFADGVKLTASQKKKLAQDLGFMSFRELSERVEDADFDIEVVAAELANIPESGQM